MNHWMHCLMFIVVILPSSYSFKMSGIRQMSDYEVARMLQQKYNMETSVGLHSDEEDIDTDLLLAKKLQNEFDSETSWQRVGTEINEIDKDCEVARKLQDELNQEAACSHPATADVIDIDLPSTSCSANADLLDPTPDIRALFLQYNKEYFWSKLSCIEVKWSTRMTLCAGICYYKPSEHYCSVRLSAPLLKFRPRSDMVNTLLHEMIHAYLFVTNNNSDHDDHGAEFHKHMRRINAAAGVHVTVYHTFHDEVDHYRQHKWLCDGPCRHRPPYYGLVSRAMNRAPSERDPWFAEHRRSCGGTYTKIHQPEGYGQKKGRKAANGQRKTAVSKSTDTADSKNIYDFFESVAKESNASQDKNKSSSAQKVTAIANIEKERGRGIPSTSRLLQINQGNSTADRVLTPINQNGNMETTENLGKLGPTNNNARAKQRKISVNSRKWTQAAADVGLFSSSDSE